MISLEVLGDCSIFLPWKAGVKRSRECKSGQAIHVNANLLLHRQQIRKKITICNEAEKQDS